MVDKSRAQWPGRVPHITTKDNTPQDLDPILHKEVSDNFEDMINNTRTEFDKELDTILDAYTEATRSGSESFRILQWQESKRSIKQAVDKYVIPEIKRTLTEQRKRGGLL